MPKIRTYEYPNHANQVKVDALKSLLPKWRTAMTISKGFYIGLLKSGVSLRRPLKYDYFRPEALGLASRQWKSVEEQVLHGMKSWVELLKLSGRSVINDLAEEYNLDDDAVHNLQIVNKSAKWWLPLGENEYFDYYDSETLLHLDSLRVELIQRILKKNPWPNFGHVNTMVMNSNIADCHYAKSAGSFEAFASIMLASRVWIDIPLKLSDYVRGKLDLGEECGVLQVSFDSDGGLKLLKPFRLPSSPPRESGTDLGIDWGMKSLVTTSDGCRFGTRLFSWLKERDSELMELQATIQRSGQKLRSSKRYRKFQHRIKSYISNEIGRILNLLAKEDIRTLVVEKLDFRKSGMSRVMNRLLSRFGLRRFYEKLDSMKEDFGVDTAFVSPSYTSQTCNSCGYVHKRNREGVKFVCGFCGRSTHADVNAARNIVARRSGGLDGMRFMSRGFIKAKLDSDFAARWGCEPSLVGFR